MNDEKKRTNRGFRIFSEDIECHNGVMRINIKGAKELIVALHELVTEAQKDDLTEPASYDIEVN